MIQRLIGGRLATGDFGAQTGLPQYGVLLSGTVSSPIIVNNSSHRILAYTLLFDQKKRCVKPVRICDARPATQTAYILGGIAPLASHRHDSSAEVRDAKGQSPTIGAKAVVLDSVLFDDGTLVGPDKAGSFDQLTARIQAEKDVHAVVVTANGADSVWTALERMASGQTVPAIQPSRSQMYQYRYQSMFKTYAAELLNVRVRAGNAAALDLARSSVFYPTIVKGEIK